MGEWDKEVISMVGEYDSGGLKIMITRKQGVAIMNRKAYIVGRRRNLHSSVSSDESVEGALYKPPFLNKKLGGEKGKR